MSHLRLVHFSIRRDMSQPARRWALNVGAWKYGVSASMDQEHREGGTWSCTGMPYFGVSVTPHFKLGGDHLYHDGPNCSCSFGFVHLVWRYWWCQKCWDDASIDEGG